MFAITGVAACAVALFAFPLGVVLQRSYRDDELLRLQRDTVAATRAVDLSSATRDQLELPRSSDRLAIYAATGMLLGGRGPAHADAIALSALRTRRPASAADGGALVAAVPLVTGERVTGVVRAQRAAGAVVGRTHRAWLALGALAGGLVALSALAALALGRRLAGPLESLAAVARRVGDGDFAARAERTRISEIDDVAAALNLSSARIDELVNRERTFSADASHQLRTPLAALRLELELLALSDAAAAPDLTVALAQVDRLQSTIETLLAVARGTPRTEQTTDLVTLVRDLQARWHGPLAAEGRPLRTRLELDHSVVAIAPVVLAEIADVLVGNAAVHGAGAVTLTARQLGDAVTLEVTDQGPGFGADADAAFARGTGRGHGIGLALARSLAHAEGARLQITDPGPAPTISLLMPAAPREESSGRSG